MKNKIWINWERHRRSYELARALKCDYFCIDYEGILRYPLFLAKTFLILLRKRPRVLVVQNPSMILSAFACIYNFLCDSFLIVDRHTTFRLNKPHTGSCKIWVFMKLHYFTLRHADLTIVTNEYLSRIVKQNGGNSFVLPDKLPMLQARKSIDLSDYKFNLLMISSFGADEPIYEVFKAMAQLEQFNDIRLYVSGNYKKGSASLIKACPKNVVMTGFLSDQDYLDLLMSVDGVVALTTSDYCMLCGCYEAIAAGKPLITSKKKVLEDYFFNAIHVENTHEEIATAIKALIKEPKMYIAKIREMRKILSKSWDDRFCHLSTIVDREYR